MNRSIIILFLCIICIMSGCIQEGTIKPTKPELGYEIVNIRDAVPQGWNYTIFQNFTGEATPSSGYSIIKTQDLKELSLPFELWKPVAIINFTYPSAQFEVAVGEYRHPSLWLYFYNITDKQEIMELIASDSMESWCIPMYFNETAKYIIVTSPCYINGGVFTEEAQRYYTPLENSLKEYFGEFTSSSPQNENYGNEIQFKDLSENLTLCIDSYRIRESEKTEFVINSNEEYLALNDYKSPADFCNDFVLPQINFTTHTLLGKYAQGGGCSINFTRKIYADDTNKTITYVIDVVEEGNCEMMGMSMNWVLISKVSSDYTIQFKVN